MRPATFWAIVAIIVGALCGALAYGCGAPSWAAAIIGAFCAFATYGIGAVCCASGGAS